MMMLTTPTPDPASTANALTEDLLGPWGARFERAVAAGNTAGHEYAARWATSPAAHANPYQALTSNHALTLQMLRDAWNKLSLGPVQAAATEAVQGIMQMGSLFDGLAASVEAANIMCTGVLQQMDDALFTPERTVLIAQAVVGVSGYGDLPIPHTKPHRLPRNKQRGLERMRPKKRKR